ncbi:hypothetical protein FKP32DRAFT_1716913 [Trametes sanguinea]|nr:hypothetical protein FKP32DRAFT_1716913 [Trametes sanguinea]
MLGVEGYGSDSDNGSDNETTQQVSPAAPSATLSSKLPAPAKKSTFSLPPPSSSASSSKPSSGLSLPPPKPKKAPKKIAIGLPSLPKDDGDRASDEDDRPPAKKARLGSGAGASGLLSMLPAPKNKTPVAPEAERVLGAGRGPGLVFKTASSTAAPARPTSTTVEDADDDDEHEEKVETLDSSYSAILEEKVQVEKKESIPFMPTSVRRGKANVSLEEKPSAPATRPSVSSAPAVDFFSLSSASSSSRPSISTLPSVSSAPPVTDPLANVPSAAPKVEDFVPPEPTPNDPYPGYYLTPTGQWAAYDPAYYKQFYDKWKKEYEAHIRALEKGKIKGFEEAEDAPEVNALKEMERAKKEIQEREERKALTTAASAVPDAPKMNIKGAALSGRARSRHQLTTLLSEAYQNREALEERIAQGRRNRKEAGNKYGF